MESVMEMFDLYYFENNVADGECISRDNGNTVVMYELDDCYGKQIVPDDPEMVCRQVKYFPDTLTLMSEGQYLKDWNEPIGVWRTYDRFGAVMEETDTDADYPVRWNEMQRILSDHHIGIDDIQRGWRQKTEEGRPEWRFQMKTVDHVMEIIRFDAENGNLIGRKSFELK